MGLFSSKKKTTVGTSVSRVIADNALPNFAKVQVIKAIMQRENISEHLMEGAIQSIGSKAERMYRYGESHYTYGLPSGKSYSATQGQEEVEAVLTELMGGPVFLEYSRYGPPNALHIGWMKLMASHGYDPATNLLGGLSASNGKPVYLHDMAVVIPASQVNNYSPEALAQWGTPPAAGYTPIRPLVGGALNHLVGHTPVRLDPSAVDEHVLVTGIMQAPRSWGEDSPGYTLQTFTIPVGEYDESADYFHAKYMYGGQTYYWIYQVGSGTHPTLDALFGAPPEVMGTFFPFLYFRYGKVSMAANTSSEGYKTSKRMAKYLGINYDDVMASIEENPDIGDVEQAMMVLAVPAESQDPLDQRYLFDFFERMYFEMDGTSSGSTPTGSSIFSRLNRASRLSANSTIIQDSRFKMALDNGGIYRRRVAGVLGPVGTHRSHIGSLQYTETYYDAWSEQDEERTTTLPVHYYRRQISSSLYDEIQVVNLKMVYFILGNYTTTGDGDDDILMIPVDRSISSSYSIPDREILYSRSLHFIFNSVVVTKVKWYQQSWFSFVLLVVAVVITVMTLGTSAQAIGLALAAGNMALVWVLLQALLVDLLIGMAIQYALVQFVQAVGLEIAFLVAVIAIAYGGYQAFQAGSLQKAGVTAQSLLQAGNGLIKAVNTNLKDALTNIYDELTAFSVFEQDQWKLLEEGNELLETNSILNPFTIFGESPDHYYKRTIHTGNIGMIGIEAVGSFVERSLTLPTLSDSIGKATPYGWV